jgi:hypothetical protein
MVNRLFETNQEFFAALRALIDAWCERRALPVLAAILPAFVSFNCMTDGWGELLFALRNIIAFQRDNLTPAEMDIVADLRRAAEKALAP